MSMDPVKDRPVEIHNKLLCKIKSGVKNFFAGIDEEILHRKAKYEKNDFGQYFGDIR